MTAVKYTPPPWGRKEIPGEARRITAMLPSGPVFIAEVFSYNGGLSVPGRANAELIAAAPDLHGALQLLVQVIEVDMGIIACLDLRILKRAKDALKKVGAA